MVSNNWEKYIVIKKINNNVIYNNNVKSYVNKNGVFVCIPIVEGTRAGAEVS